MRKICTVISVILFATTYGQSTKNPKSEVGNILGFEAISVQKPETRFIFRCRAISISADPLLIIDGVVYDYRSIGKISPDSIESIAILKDAAASALYGSEGANGVIIITTKSSRFRKFVIKDFLEGKPIPGATVKFILQDKTDSLIQIANDSGVVIIGKLKAGLDYNIQVSSIGFNPCSTQYKSSVVNKEQVIFLEKKINGLREIVITTPGFKRCRDCGCRLRSIITYNYGDTEDSMNPSLGKIYPNPVQHGNNFNLELPTTISPASSSYIIRIISLSGTIIHQQKVDSSKWKTVSIASSNRWAAGAYFVQVLNDKGKPCELHKIIIQ